MSLVCTSIQSFTCVLDITDDYLFMFCFLINMWKYSVLDLLSTSQFSLNYQLSLKWLKFINDDCNMSDNLATKSYFKG